MLAKGLSKRLIALGLSSTLAISGAYLISPFDGSKKDKQGNNIAYIDMVGVPTLCNGITTGVKLGDKKTDAECEQLLAKELSKYNTQMKKNVRVSLSPYEEIAYTSFVWNVGVGAWNNSTLLKKLNANDRVGACNEILKWNKGTFSRQASLQQSKNGEICTPKPNGTFSCTIKGLTNRRKVEHQVCLGNSSEINNALRSVLTEGADNASQ